MPDTKPGISFIDGVCNACQNAEINNKKNFEDYQYVLRTKVVHGIHAQAGFSSCGYGCVVPVSGGKDSTFLAMKARELGLNPLCVNVAPCVPTARGERNLGNLSKLGFDIFRFFSNQRIMPTLVKRSFVEDGDPCTSHEFMLYTVPVRMAMKFMIPLIFWAEDPQFEYGNSGDVKGADEQRNIAGLWGRPASHWVCEGVEEEDLNMFEHPTAEQIGRAGLEAIYMSRYIRWDSQKIAKFAIKHGMEVRPYSELEGTGGYWDFEQLDDETPIIGHYLKFVKFGYGRATDQACRDIRLGYLTRQQGLACALQFDGHISPIYIDNFCRYIDITVKEFNVICETFRGKK